MKTLVIRDINNDAYVYSGTEVEQVAFKHVKELKLPKNNQSNILPNYMKTQEYMYAFYQANNMFDELKDPIGIFLSNGTCWYTDSSTNQSDFHYMDDVIEVRHCFSIDTFLDKD